VWFYEETKKQNKKGEPMKIKLPCILIAVLAGGEQKQK
jgi:hypothetical protein